MAVQNRYRVAPVKYYENTFRGAGIKDPSKEAAKKSEHLKKKETIAKGVKVSKAEAVKSRKKAGGSNVGEYKGVSKSDFAGPAGGAPKGSFPINTKKRAKAALAYARNAPNPTGIKKAVYKKYPEMKPKKK